MLGAIGGSGQFHAWTIMTTLTIGRRSDCHIVVDNPTVSRLHAELTPLGAGKFTLRDTDSAAGTFVRDGQIWRKINKTTVTMRDTVRLGDGDYSVADLLAMITDPTISIEVGGAKRGDPSGSGSGGSSSGSGKVRFERDPITGQIVEKR
jgi:hypothetical protein